MALFIDIFQNGNFFSRVRSLARKPQSLVRVEVAFERQNASDHLVAGFVCLE